MRWRGSSASGPSLALLVMRNLLLSTIETVRRLTADVASLES